PSNDASDMSKLLTDKDFDVRLKHNLNMELLDEEILDFYDVVKEGKFVTLFYFAGHGVQVDGQNYLMPVGQEFRDQTQIKHRAYPLNELLDRLSENKNNLNIIILDACRNNPFETRRGFGGSGLAEISVNKGTFIAFATSPGKTASDSSLAGRNGLYTSHLLNSLKRTALGLDQVFKLVREGVFNESNETQLPWVSNSLIGDFCFDTKVDKVKSLPATFQETCHFEFSSIVPQDRVFTKFIQPVRTWGELIIHLELICEEGHSERPFCVEILSKDENIIPLLCVTCGGNVDYGYGLVTFEEYLENNAEYGCFSNKYALESAKGAPEGSELYYSINFSERLTANQLVSWPAILWNIENTDEASLGSFHATLINMVKDPLLKYPSLEQLMDLLKYLPKSQQGAFVKIVIDNVHENECGNKFVKSSYDYVLTGYCNIRKTFIGYDKRFCCIPEKTEWLTYSDLINILSHVPEYQLKEKLQMNLMMGFIWKDDEKIEFEECCFLLGHLDSRIVIPE
ncbi:MAG: caspase family protein, partial [Oceanospirillaceae bacterium]